MMSTQTIDFAKPAHTPSPMTSNLGDDMWILTCLELSCENSVQTRNFDQECQGVCHGNCVLLTCTESSEGGWEKL
jgi:hypothetical protein